jgi:hypothetical protein
MKELLIGGYGKRKDKDGKGDNKFVITVAPQKLICPKGKT